MFKRQSRTLRLTLLAGVIACALPAGFALAAEKTEKTGKGKPELFVGQREENSSGQAAGGEISLGAGSGANTLVVKTPPLPAGKYHISYNVGLSIGEHNNVVCGLHSSLGVFNPMFGGAGNPGTGSIYGDAGANEYVEVTNANEQIEITCNKTSSSTVVDAGLATVTAEKVGTLVVDTQ